MGYCSEHSCQFYFKVIQLNFQFITREQFSYEFNNNKKNSSSTNFRHLANVSETSLSVHQVERKKKDFSRLGFEHKYYELPFYHLDHIATATLNEQAKFKYILFPTNLWLTSQRPHWRENQLNRLKKKGRNLGNECHLLLEVFDDSGVNELASLIATYLHLQLGSRRHIFPCRAPTRGAQNFANYFTHESRIVQTEFCTLISHNPPALNWFCPDCNDSILMDHQPKLWRLEGNYANEARRAPTIPRRSIQISHIQIKSYILLG